MSPTVSFRYEVPFGHRLMFHQGKCRFPHGHNYIFEVEVSGPLDEQGFVMDFSILKRLVREFFEPFDHAFVLYQGDPFVNELRKMTSKVVVLDVHPTAENLAALVAGVVENACPGYTVRVVCREQRDCTATSGGSIPRIVERWEE